MTFRLTLFLSFVLFSCKEQSDKFNYETSIASKVYEAQLKYLDNTLYNYSEISKSGAYYFQENHYLDEAANKFKKQITKGGVLTTAEKEAFYDHFEKTFAGNNRIDFDLFKQLRNLPIKTTSDIDLLRVYIKNNFVCILLNNKLLPYDTWSTMACAYKSTINKGEEFEVALGNTAWNNAQPNEWFLVKRNEDSLTKENIIDTLHQDISGIVYFKTKTYKKGENRLTFISRLNAPGRQRMLSREVTFFVK
jgi:hypothetical protein